MSRSRLVALSGICTAVSLVSIFLANYVTWVSFMLGVISACAVSVPLIVDGKNGKYSLMCYIASGVLGVFLGVGNIVYVLPIVVFAMPMTLIKVYGESTVVRNEVERQRISTVWRWILYYLLGEICLALTFGAAYLFAKPLFERLFDGYIYLMIIAIVNIAIPLYNRLLTGCIALTRYAVSKAWH